MLTAKNLGTRVNDPRRRRRRPWRRTLPLRRLSTLSIAHGVLADRRPWRGGDLSGVIAAIFYLFLSLPNWSELAKRVNYRTYVYTRSFRHCSSIHNIRCLMRLCSKKNNIAKKEGRRGEQIVTDVPISPYQTAVALREGRPFRATITIEIFLFFSHSRSTVFNP